MEKGNADSKLSLKDMNSLLKWILELLMTPDFTTPLAVVVDEQLMTSTLLFTSFTETLSGLIAPEVRKAKFGNNECRIENPELKWFANRSHFTVKCFEVHPKRNTR
ncbi:hypothetical protein J6590_103680 [Homalodisca vitripennis]|nr:hypothetical protein J6590_103680 [Homalodisca vitripennis]